MEEIKEIEEISILSIISFQKSNNIFFAKYQNARIIVNLGEFISKENAKLTPQPVE